jgi:predicted AAA+ superfamily ATPase
MNIEREIKKDINTKLFKGKVIIIYGPRRVGKTTLAKEIVAPFGKDAKYFSCDDVSVRLALTNKNHNELKEFLGEGKIFVIDEAQRVYNIGLTLKIIVDNYQDIQIIATGSSSFELANKINEPLTGRHFSYILYPISISEIKDSLKNSFNILINI